MSTALLLTHLHNADPAVTPTTLFGALAHHLAHDHPTPVSLAASAVSAPYFLKYPPSYERLQGLVTSFQHAVILKHEALIKAREGASTFNRTLFSPSVSNDLQEWVKHAHQGLRGGRPLFRFAACTGLLLGMKQIGGLPGRGREKVEDDTAVALAEVLDDYTVETGDWEREFGSHVDETSLSLTLIVASQSLPLLPATKLDALPLSLLAPLLASSICAGFGQGTFLNTNSQTKPIPQEQLASISTSPTMANMSSLSKLLALVLGHLVTSAKDGLEVAKDVLVKLDNVATAIEGGWLNSPLSSAPKGDELETEESVRTTWNLLKTYLFAVVMILDGVLGNVVYRRPQSLHIRQPLTTPHTLSQLSLQMLSHLSFVVSQFGGVTASYSEDGPSFVQLHKVFYLALDVLNSAQSQEMCEGFVQKLLADLSNTPDRVRPEKTAFVFACIEQCIPRLGIRCLEEQVLPTCVPYLSDSSNREIYESAHSVVLTIFASQGQRNESGLLEVVELPEADADGLTLDNKCRVSHTTKINVCQNEDQLRLSSDMTDLIRRMVPFYAQCLIDNSKEGMLSTVQLRLAYAALVKGACSGANISPKNDRSLGWYCVSLLVDSIKSLSTKALGIGQEHEARRHRLCLTLISTVPSLPLLYLVPALEQVRQILVANSTAAAIQPTRDPEKHKELVAALFQAIQEDVGDVQKSVALRWWYDNREIFGLAREIIVEKGMEKEEATLQPDPHVLSRL